MIETINKMVRTQRTLIQELGREPTSEEIAARMELPVDKVKKSSKGNGESATIRGEAIRLSKKLYRLEGKFKEAEGQGTFEDILHKALNEPYWD